jgi:hydroxymethylbilane synthase
VSNRGTIRIGTRESALAQWQAEHVASLLRALPGTPNPELVLIRTEGDKIQNLPLSKVQGKAFFTKEIEEALLRDEVDIAVHSLKDLATEMHPDLALGAVIEREDPRDVLLFSPGLVGGEGRAREGAEAPRAGRVAGSGEAPWAPDDLPRGAKVGTSSLRRRALLTRWRPDLELAELRGNVPTRIGKLDNGGYDAIVLGAAGVKRLGLGYRISAYLPLDSFLPAVSQGAIGVQMRRGDSVVALFAEGLNHRETQCATEAERAFLRTLEGGCQVPVGGHAVVVGRELRLRGVVCALDGSHGVDGEMSGPAETPEELGVRLAEDLLRRGGDSILQEIRGGGVTGEGSHG